MILHAALIVRIVSGCLVWLAKTVSWEKNCLVAEVCLYLFIFTNFVHKICYSEASALGNLYGVFRFIVEVLRFLNDYSNTTYR